MVQEPTLKFLLVGMKGMAAARRNSFLFINITSWDCH
jgi:hypothetical protein